MALDLQGWLILLAIGLVVGFLAGQIMKGAGFGIVGNIVVGLAGSVLGGWLLGGLIGGGLIGAIVTGVIGACLLIFVLRLILRKT